MFNSKKIEELERRIKALEPKGIDEVSYVTATCSEEADPVKALQERVGKLEKEVMPSSDLFSLLYINALYGRGGEPKRLSLREKVDRICAHLKITFKTEPEKVVIAPIKAKKR